MPPVGQIGVQKIRGQLNEEVYLKAYDSVGEARASLGCYLAFYNHASEHPSGYVIEENRFF